MESEGEFSGPMKSAAAIIGAVAASTAVVVSIPFHSVPLLCSFVEIRAAAQNFAPPKSLLRLSGSSLGFFGIMKFVLVAKLGTKLSETRFR